MSRSKVLSCLATGASASVATAPISLPVHFDVEKTHHEPLQIAPCLDPYPVCCSATRPGFHVFPPSFWQDIERFADNYHVRELMDSTPRMLERHYTFYNMIENYNLHESEVRAAWLEECAFGVLTIFLNALPAMEFEHGLFFAQQQYMHALDLAEQLHPSMKFANWTVPIQPLYTTWPFLLGLVGSSCGDTDIKVFVYEDLKGGYADGGLFCSAGQWGIEVLMHRFFQTASCRTGSMDEADFFFVPDYRACHYHLTPVIGDPKGTMVGDDGIHSQVIKNHEQKSRRIEYADEIFLNLTKQLPAFHKNGGVDHMFVFSDQGFVVNFTHVFPSWKQHIPNSIFLTTEAETPGCGVDCFSPWKDIVLPGHLDQERIDKIRALNKPTDERTLLFSFHGRMGLNHDYYKNITVRNMIGHMIDLPNVSIGGFTNDYFEIIGNSHFCLIPVGTSSWTNHLYTAFFAGCIPIILSDKFVLPFADVIPWPTLSIRLMESDVHYLYSYVENLVHENIPRIKLMKEQLEKHQCWFEWYNPESNCSPYRALIKQLERRKRAMPPYTLGTWAPPLDDFPRDEEYRYGSYL